MIEVRAFIIVCLKKGSCIGIPLTPELICVHNRSYDTNNKFYLHLKLRLKRELEEYKLMDICVKFLNKRYISQEKFGLEERSC